MANYRQFQPVNVAQNYFAGRQFADDEALRGSRNALAQQDVAMGQRFNALADNPDASASDYARIGRSDVANSLTNQQRFSEEQQRQIATTMVHAAQYGLQSQQPQAFIEQNYPQLAQLAGDQWAALDDNGVKAKLQEAIGVFGPKAGIGPAEPEPSFEQMQGPNGSTIVKRGDKWQIVEPRQDKPQPQFRPMRPEEIAASGLPPGTAAQVNDSTGQISVLSKRDATSSLSQKDAATAKQKMTTIVLARQQLQNIQQRFNDLKDTFSAGPGGSKLPTPKGQSFDRAVDQMRSTLTALTKVPGIGAMSDYETRLDQSKFPSRGDYENVTQQQIDDIRMMLDTLDQGYRGLLEGTAPTQQQQEPDLSQLSNEDLLKALAGG